MNTSNVKIRQMANVLIKIVRRKNLYSFWMLTMLKIKNMINKITLIRVGLYTETKNIARSTSLLI